MKKKIWSKIRGRLEWRWEISPLFKIQMSIPFVNFNKIKIGYLTWTNGKMIELCSIYRMIIINDNSWPFIFINLTPQTIGAFSVRISFLLSTLFPFACWIITVVIKLICFYTSLDPFSVCRFQQVDYECIFSPVRDTSIFLIIFVIEMFWHSFNDTLYVSFVRT